MSIFRFGNLTTEPEIHRGGGKQKRGERRIPCAVKNVTGDDEEIFSRRPRSDAPVKRDDDHEENDERERVKKHDEKSIRLTCRSLHPIYVSHIEGSFFNCCFVTLQDKEAHQVPARFSMVPLTSIVSRLPRSTRPLPRGLPAMSRFPTAPFSPSLRESKPSAAGEGAFAL